MKTIKERIQIVANKLNTTYGNVKLMIYSTYGIDTISPENKLLTLEKHLGINKEDKSMKAHSIMSVPIVEVSYKVKKQTTICRIKWINPATGNTQITCGIATCNPDDKFITSIGMRLSESRAKINMYKTYIELLKSITAESCGKHYLLISQERGHQTKIKPSKENNM